MKSQLFIYIISIAMLNSCMPKKQKDIFILPFKREYTTIKVNLDTVRNPIVLSDSFWHHFTSTFPSATIVLFSKSDDDYDNNIELSDTTYTYGLLSRNNSIFFQNHLPKNLSKEESESYWEGIGLFVIPDSTDVKDGHEPEVTLERHWTKASKKVEKEYLQFYSFIMDYDQEYAVVVKKTLVDSILKKHR